MQKVRTAGGPDLLHVGRRLLPVTLETRQEPAVLNQEYGSTSSA